MLKWDKLGAFLRKSGLGQECAQLSNFLFDTVPEFLVIDIREEKKTNGKIVGKEAIKLSLFADDMLFTYEKNHYWHYWVFKKSLGSNKDL